MDRKEDKYLQNMMLRLETCPHNSGGASYLHIALVDLSTSKYTVQKTVVVDGGRC